MEGHKGGVEALQEMEINTKWKAALRDAFPS